jgi:hypothetical protein
MLKNNYETLQKYRSYLSDLKLSGRLNVMKAIGSLSMDLLASVLETAVATSPGTEVNTTVSVLDDGDRNVFRSAGNKIFTPLLT